MIGKSSLNNSEYTIILIYNYSIIHQSSKFNWLFVVSSSSIKYLVTMPS